MGNIFVPMKSYIILLVAVTMLLKPLWPVADYVMNYDYIVNVLCENRDRPELQCDGKCYLAQQLAKEAENQKNPFGEKQSRTEIQQFVFFQSLINFDFSTLLPTNSDHYFGDVPTLVSILYSPDNSQPPEFV